jgi:exopolysaccharide biosynthesis WecB/TagA/CpsF family protein
MHASSSAPRAPAVPQEAGPASAGRDLPALDILGVALVPLARGDALARVASASAPGRHLKLAFANAHTLNLASEQPAFAATLARFLVLPDGIGVDLAARLLQGRPFPANLNGTDFVPDLVAMLPPGARVRLLGGRPGVAERAAMALGALAPGLDVASLGHGYFVEDEQPALLARLASERPDLLLVAFGNPRQELWIGAHLDARHAGVAAGVGALFDFLAGEAPRAPAGWRALRLEWLHRLLNDPGRLWRRYLLGNPLFLARVARQVLRQRRAPRATG